MIFDVIGWRQPNKSIIGFFHRDEPARGRVHPFTLNLSDFVFLEKGGRQNA